MKQPATATEDAETNNERILNSFRGAYEALWHIVPQELVQNGTDARGQHIGDDLFAADREVVLDHTVDRDARTVEYADNVGGMTRNVLADVVTTIAETDSVKELKESGGSFGLGLWMLAAVTEAENGGVYIETRREGSDEPFATVLYPTGKHYTSGDGEYPHIDTPAKVREAAGVELDGESVTERDVGGTVIRVENIEPDVAENLTWENIEQRLRYKFPTLTGVENFDVRWEIDDEEHFYETPTLDEFAGDVSERRTDVPISKGDEGAVVDEVVFYNAKMEAPWENVPLMKTEPHSGRPYMVVDDYSVRKAGTITDADGAIVGLARIDTVCDDYGWEDPAHEGVQFDPSQHTDIGDMAKELQKDYLQEHIRDHSIDTEVATAAANDTLAEMRNRVAEMDGAKLEHFGFDSDTPAELTVRPCDGHNHDDATLEIEATAKVDPDATGPEVPYEVAVTATKQGTDEQVDTETFDPTLGAGEKFTADVELDVPADGAYFVNAELADAATGEQKDTSGVLLGVNKDVAPTGGGGGGGGGTTDDDPDALADTVVDGTPLRVKKTRYCTDGGDVPVWAHREDDGWVASIDLDSDEWLSAAMRAGQSRVEKQRKTAARGVIEDIVKVIMTEQNDVTEEQMFAFRRLDNSMDSLMAEI